MTEFVQTPNYFRQGDGALVLNGAVVFDAGYDPSGSGQQIVTPGDHVPALAGTLTGSVDGTLADVAAIALSTSNTYSDSAVNTAVNTAITGVNLQLKELQATLNAVIAALEGNSVLADS